MEMRRKMGVSKNSKIRKGNQIAVVRRFYGVIHKKIKPVDEIHGGE